MPIRESNNCVFILGAGSSAPYGIPAMRQFFDYARRHFFKMEKQNWETFLRQSLEQMFDFHQRCTEMSVLDRDWDNLEELYTQADFLRLAGIPDANTAEELCSRIAWSIWEIYRQLPTELPELSKICDRVCQAGLRPVFVTTNYDLIVEAAIDYSTSDSRGFRYHYPGFETPGNNSIPGLLLPTSFRKSIAPEADSVPVIKLHGSVNWFDAFGCWVAVTSEKSQSGEGSIELSTTGFAALQSMIRDRIMSTDPPTEINTENSTIKPGITPPMLGKAANGAVIPNQWRAAIEEISRARQVWIIGYSFPPTDAFMSRLFTEAFKQNHDLEKLVIVDKQPLANHGIQSILQQRFRSNRCHYIEQSSLEVYGWIQQFHFGQWLDQSRVTKM